MLSKLWIASFLVIVTVGVASYNRFTSNVAQNATEPNPDFNKQRRPMTALPQTGQAWRSEWVKYPADDCLPKGLAVEVTGGVITGICDENPGKPARDILGTRYVEGDLDATDITPALWRFIDLEMPKPDGSIAKLSVGRPLWWMQQTGAKAGATIDLGMQEIGISGSAKVLRISPWTEDSRDNPPNQNIVTGKIEHQNAVLYDLVFNHDTGKALGVTANHPIHSSDRDDWVAAGELNIGEKVRTLNGTATLTAKSQRPGRHTVYNLEVHRSHAYHVSQFGILAHNSNVLDCGQTPVYRGAGTKKALPRDITVDRKTGLVIPKKTGLSVHVDQQKTIDRFGSAQRVKSIPDELQIVQQGGDPGHYGISPKAPMTPARFQELLDQVEFYP